MLAQSVVMAPRQIMLIGGAQLPRGASPAQLVGAVPTKDIVLVRPQTTDEASAPSDFSHTVIGELPLPLAGHVAASMGDSVWVVGGFSAENIAPRAVFRIDFDRQDDGTVAKVSKIELFKSHRIAIFPAHAVVANKTDEVLVVWGGFSAATGSLKLAATNAMQVLVPPAPKANAAPFIADLDQLGTVPSARVAAAACGVGNSIFLCGGRRGDAVCHEVFMGSIAWRGIGGEVAWRAISTSAEGAVPRFGHSVVQDQKGRFLIAGGWEAIADGSLTESSSVTVGELESDHLKLYRTDQLLVVHPSHATCVGIPSGLVVVNMDRTAVHHPWPSDALELIRGETVSSGVTDVVERDRCATPPKSVTPPPPDVMPEDLVFRLAVAPKNAGNLVSLSRRHINVDAFRATVLSASGVSAEDAENALIFMTTRDGRERPVHLPDTLARVAVTAVEPVPLTIVVEKPPRNYQTTYPSIGKGTFGTVYRAINTADNRSFCLKRVRIESTRPSCTIADLTREIRMMRHLRHENLVRYLGSKHEQGAMYIFMEFVTGDTLEKTCRSIPMTIRQIQLCVRQVLSALEYLHSFNVVHRDIKGANVLFDAEGRVKVSDFGTAKHLNPSTMTSSNRPAGTILYMAPEVMKAEPTTTAADIWSLGCLVIEMASGNYPYAERGFTDPIQVVNALCNHKTLPKIPDRLSDDGKEFVRACLQLDAAARPTCAQLARFRFVTQLAPDEPVQAAHPTSSPGTTAVFAHHVQTLHTADSMVPELRETKGNKPTKLRRPKPPS